MTVKVKEENRNSIITAGEEKIIFQTLTSKISLPLFNINMLLLLISLPNKARTHLERCHAQEKY